MPRMVFFFLNNLGTGRVFKTLGGEGKLGLGGGSFDHHMLLMHVRTCTALEVLRVITKTMDCTNEA